MDVDKGSMYAPKANIFYKLIENEKKHLHQQPDRS